MLQIVLIANPQTRRVELFQQALAALALPPAQLISYEDLLNQCCTLTSWERTNAYFRFDAPERNFATDCGFIAAGADIDAHGLHQRISAAAAFNLPEDKGRILYPRQWYLGWRSRLQTWTQSLQNPILNHPDDIAVMFDKIQCQRLLAEAGIPIARSLTHTYPIGNYEQLKDRMENENCDRVFVKLAHGSSASGIVAYERRGHLERAITTVERVVVAGELRLYNSRNVRQYTNPTHIAEIINFLARETIQVEAWIPKARIEGREFDVRVVVIGGKARQVVLRLGKSPMTNLHLGSDRRTLEDLPAALTPDAWTTMLETCERTAACFSKTFYCGIDLLIAPNFRDHFILEVNAFGDLLPDISWNGQDTYTTQLLTLLQTPCRPNS